MNKTAPGSSLIVHEPKSLAVIDKPIVTYEGEILFIPTQSSKVDKLTKDKALTIFSRICFAFAGFVLLKGHVLAAWTPF